MSYRRCHATKRWGRLLVLVGLATVVAFGPRAAAQQTPQNDVEGLGFSMAPKEGGKARTRLFGVVGEGYKFVYVFDRSGSMGGSGQRALRAAKGELIRSLEPLDTVHQFQLIFYNEEPLLFNPSGASGRLAFATDANKRRAIRFIDSVQAVGGTNHEDALRLAIRLQPDVIFLLTDADEPSLTAAQLDKIRTLAAGIVINAIEFGDGPKLTGASFLEALARENGGGYAYVDLSKRTDDGREKK
ncbi:MAG: VWA domain-containing protein [Planctomycetaceae bacterium]|nr:VWA domain-containing protein [Planctomycetaceae bacterium]